MKSKITFTFFCLVCLLYAKSKKRTPLQRSDAIIETAATMNTINLARMPVSLYEQQSNIITL